jgi:cysteine-rich repeat protein
MRRDSIFGLALACLVAGSCTSSSDSAGPNIGNAAAAGVGVGGGASTDAAAGQGASGGLDAAAGSEPSDGSVESARAPGDVDAADGGSAGAAGSMAGAAGSSAAGGGAAGSVSDAGLIPVCGDGALDVAEGEQCDDANTEAGDGCDPKCQFESVGAACGDGIVEPAEACDDANLANGDGCNPTCSLKNTTSLFVGSPGISGWKDDKGAAARIGASGLLAADNNVLWLADGSNFMIRSIDIATATVTTIAGNGAQGYRDHPTGNQAQFGWIGSMGTDGRTLWIADARRIRTVDTAPPYAVATVAGSGNQAVTDGIGLAAEFDDPRGLTWYDHQIYLLDAAAAVLRRFDPKTGQVVTLAGSAYQLGNNDGVGHNARFQSPRAMVSDNKGTLFIADTNGGKIRAYYVATNTVGTFAGSGAPGYADGVGTGALIHRPRGITTDGTSLYWAEFSQQTIRQGVQATASVSTLIGKHCGGASSCPGGYAEGVGVAALINGPFSIAYHPPSRSLFVSDSGNYVIRRVQ